MNQQHLAVMGRLLDEAQRRGLPLWIGGGWAIDARLGRVTRQHEDIDISFPAEREVEFLAMLAAIAGQVAERTDYGFLASMDEVLLDCEPCRWNGDAYEVEGAPAGSCPPGFEGNIEGRPVRCSSWEAILWDYFYYIEEVPQAQWREKDFLSFGLARSAFGQQNADALHTLFRLHHAA